MKLSPITMMKIAAVLSVALVMLGCEAPATTASEQTVPVYPVAAVEPQPALVTVLAAPQAEVNATIPQPAAPLAAPPSAGAPAAPASDLVTVVTNAIPEVPAEDLIAAVQTNRPPVQISERLQEVVRLAQSGVGEDVVLAFVQNSPAPFNPTPDEIVYLTDIGLSDVVITALVNHRGTQTQVAEQPAQPAPESGPAAVEQPQPAPEMQGEAIYNPEPQVVYSAPPTVEYVSPSPAVEYPSFYSSLAPYGTWINVVDYGWCWQPSVAVIHSSWRPYWDRGRWLYSDHGWYWHSDYSWGWAPFHYGRWFHHPRRGWCWRPGDVWGPAWVSWRYTDAHCGWAPLPPGAHFRHGLGFTYYGAHVGIGFSFGLHHDRWNFVPKHRFHDREIWRHGIRPHERLTAYRRSTVVNNYTVVNNTIINKGMEPDRLPGARRGEIRKVAIRDLPEQRGASVRPDRPRQEGSQTVVYRPRPQEIQRHSLSSLETRPSRTSPSWRPATPGASADGTASSAAVTGRRNEPRPSSIQSRAVGSSNNGSPATGRPAEVAPSRPQGSAPGRASGSPSWSVFNSQTRETRRDEPQAAPAPSATSRPQRSSSTLGSVAAPQRIPSTRSEPAAAPTYRLPSSSRPIAPQSSSSRPANEVFQRSAGAEPQAVAPPARVSRQEPVKAAPVERPTFRAPSANNSVTILRNSPVQGPSFSLPQQSRPAPSFSAPAVRSRSYSPPVQSRPAPVQSRSYSAPVQTRSYAPPVQSRSYSAPVQSRPAPVQSRSYSAPVQSRPSQSFSLPSSRSAAPQSAPAPSRSGGRRQ